jgi:hypothetical protein
MPTAIGAPPQIVEISITVADQAVELQFDENTVGVTVVFDTNDGRVAFTGTEGSPLGSFSALQPGDTLRKYLIKPATPARLLDGRSMFFSASTVPTTLRLFTDAG